MHLKKITIVLTGLLHLAVITSCSDDVLENVDNASNRTFSVNDFACQEEANLLNEQIMDGIRLNSRSEDLSSQYPDYYGGSFIEPKGDLVIFIAGDSINGVNAIKEISSDPIIQFKRCTFSYQTLLNVIQDLKNLVETAPIAIAENITAFGLNQKLNQVNVCLADISSNKIDEFKQIYNHPAVTFLHMDKVEYQGADVCPGFKITLNSVITDNYFGSVGFRVREKSGSKRTGFVTAGHVIESDESCFIDGSNVGLCVSSNAYGAKADAAFIVAESSASLSNYINGDTSAELSTKTSQPGEGTLVNLWGAQSGHTWGYIVNTQYYLTQNNTVVTSDLVAAEYTSETGDSGGIIYTYTSSNKQRFTVGIHLGRATNPDTQKSYSIYSKADNVLNMFNLERY